MQAAIPLDSAIVSDSLVRILLEDSGLFLRSWRLCLCGSVLSTYDNGSISGALRATGSLRVTTELWWAVRSSAPPPAADLSGEPALLQPLTRSRR
jgi:hypothetical protein